MIARHQDCRKADEPVTVLNHLGSNPRLFDRNATSSYSTFEIAGKGGIRGYLQDASENLQCKWFGQSLPTRRQTLSPFENGTCLFVTAGSRALLPDVKNLHPDGESAAVTDDPCKIYSQHDPTCCIALLYCIQTADYMLIVEEIIGRDRHVKWGLLRQVDSVIIPPDLLSQ